MNFKVFLLLNSECVEFAYLPILEMMAWWIIPDWSASLQAGLASLRSRAEELKALSDAKGFLVGYTGDQPGPPAL